MCSAAAYSHAAIQHQLMPRTQWGVGDQGLLSAMSTCAMCCPSVVYYHIPEWQLYNACSTGGCMLSPLLYTTLRQISPKFGPAAAPCGWQEEDVVFFLDYTGPAGLVQQAARLCHR
jgi:hypothetical protein